MNLSLEIFPPKTRQGRQKLEKLIDNNIDVMDTISVTQTSSDYELTRFIVRYFDNDPRIVPHITSGLAPKDEIKKVVEDLSGRGTKRYLLLTGDNPNKSNDYYPDAFTMMYDLHYQFPEIEFVSTFYPEPHKKFKSLEEDRKFIENRINLGTKKFFGQMCFSADKIVDYVNAVTPRNGDLSYFRAGIVAPMTKFTNLFRICLQNNIALPEDISTNMYQVTDKLVGDLIKAGVTEFHMYAMNNEDNLKRLLDIIRAHQR